MKQTVITSMRHHVVDHVGRCHPALGPAHPAERFGAELLQA